MVGDAFSRCHPIINFFYFTVILGFTMFVQHPVLLAISFAAGTSYAVLLSGWRKVVKMNLVLTLPGLAIAAVINPLLNHYGVTPLFYIESSGNWVTLEALVYGVVLGCVMFIVIQWFSCYNKVMTSDKFIYLFGRVIPALSLILSMALRFVPHFGAQLKIIRSGQKCSGKDISNAGLIKKAKYGLNMLSILITWALENAIDTADSMRSRGYGLRGRTAFSIYRFDRRDRLLGGVLGVLCVIFSWGVTKGAAFSSYNPRILLAGFTIQGKAAPVECSAVWGFVTFAAFSVFCFAPVILGIVEERAMVKSRQQVGSDMDITYRRIYEDMKQEEGTQGWIL